jgi:hypothetical protein
MSNVLSEAKKQQVIALGRLGWPLRRIEQETGVRRETAGAYLKAAGIGVRPPGAWGRRPPAKPANENGVTTGSDAAKPANKVNPNPNPENLSTKGKAKARSAKPANENAVTTGFGVELSDSEHESPQPIPSISLCEPFREAIELGLSQGRNAIRIVPLKTGASYWEIAPPLPPCSIVFSIMVMYSNVVLGVGVQKWTCLHSRLQGRTTESPASSRWPVLP